MSGPPDPKPVRRPRPGVRIADREAMTRAKLLNPDCIVCGRPGANADHVVRRGNPWLGDDVLENLIVLCGSGNTECHGARHGIPYTDRRGRRWTPQEVRRRIGHHIARQRPDVVAYVLAKLGDGPGRDYLARMYELEV